MRMGVHAAFGEGLGMLWTAEMHGHAWGSTERIGMLWLMGMSWGLCGLNEKMARDLEGERPNLVQLTVKAQ